MGPGVRNTALELLDDRIGMRLAVITSQWLVKAWNTCPDGPTRADAILDRVGRLREIDTRRRWVSMTADAARPWNRPTEHLSLPTRRRVRRTWRTWQEPRS